MRLGAPAALLGGLAVVVGAPRWCSVLLGAPAALLGGLAVMVVVPER